MSSNTELLPDHMSWALEILLASLMLATALGNYQKETKAERAEAEMT
jgi:hypothetical protein